MIGKRLASDAYQYELEELDRSLKQCLSQWFSGGFLHLEQLTWQSSCDVMEKVWVLHILITSYVYIKLLYVAVA